MSGGERQRLLDLLRQRSWRRGPVRLASGRTSIFYVDCKQTSLTAEGHFLVGSLLLELVDQGGPAAAVAGITMGGDPLASAVSLTSWLQVQAGRRVSPLDALLVRKEAKGHGTGAFLEGASHLVPGCEVVLLEDVVTTGGSSLKGVERLREAGFSVRRVVALLDRQEGGGEALAGAGLTLEALFCRSDITGEAR